MLCVLCRASLLARLHLGRFLIFHHLPYPMQFHTQGVFIVPCSPSFRSTPLPRNIRALFSTTALPRGVANLKGGGGKYNEIYIMYYWDFIGKQNLRRKCNNVSRGAIFCPRGHNNMSTPLALSKTVVFNMATWFVFSKLEVVYELVFFQIQIW